MARSISIRRLQRAIEMLPPDRVVRDPSVWYRNQREHWLGWLREYSGQGAYGRDTTVTRDARFAYNHIMNYQMLLWLARASGVSGRRLQAARDAVRAKSVPARQCAAVRKSIPWEIVEGALWPHSH